MNSMAPSTLTAAGFKFQVGNCKQLTYRHALKPTHTFGHTVSKNVFAEMIRFV